MARKSAKSNKSTPASARRSSSKRAAPEKATPTRQSKRAKPAKSMYIEPSSEQDMEDQSRLSSEDGDSTKASDYEDMTSKDVSSESEHGEAYSEDDMKPKKRASRGRRTKPAVSLRQKDAEKELWKPGAKLAPGTQLIIKKPKAREAGDTPYTDDAIHPNTMLFLADLAANNERQWLKMHDPDYRVALQDFTTFLEKLSERVTEADGTIPELPVKDIIFRIYRDVRFSKDQTPYKTHFSAAWSRTGRKGPYAAYYVQIQPGGGSFVGGGLWQPDAQALSKLRRDIDRKPHKIKRVLMDEGIRRVFLGGVANDEKKAIKAFINLSENKSTALKKHPKGYEGDHKDIDLLRLRNFTLGTKLSDEQVVGSRGLDQVAEIITSMVPFITYLNNIVMPDEESSGSSEDEEDDDHSGEGEGEGEGEDEGDGDGADEDDEMGGDGA